MQCKLTWASGFISVVLLLLPVAVHASVRIANCDNKAYDVIITNAGSQHLISLPPLAGSFEEQGDAMMMTLQIKDTHGPQPVVQPNSPGEEYCIWGGRILVQRLNTTNSMPTGHGWR